MKFIQYFSLASLVAAPAFASEAVLIQRIGSLANSSGRADICEIHSNHPDLKGIDVQALAAAAEKEPMSKALHIVAQIPSEEIYVVRRTPVGPHSPTASAKPLLLHKDYSDMQTRSGKASKELIELTEKLCK